MMLSLDTAYRSFGGEVEASSTPTICRLSDSRRHQLSAIAHDSANRVGLHDRFSSLDDTLHMDGSVAARVAKRQGETRYNNRCTQRDHHDFKVRTAVGAINGMVHLSLLHLSPRLDREPRSRLFQNGFIARNEGGFVGIRIAVSHRPTTERKSSLS